MSVRVFAPAKINLTLKVGRPRADGMHPLASVIAFADVGDWVEARPAPLLGMGGITGPFAGALSDLDGNLVNIAAHALRTHVGHDFHAEVSLEKNLPIASGVGGGSSDAAAALKALNALCELNLNEAELMRVAARIGADVPVCVRARPAFVTGIGEMIAPLDLPRLHAVLVNPLQPLSTADVFRQFDRGEPGELAAGPPPRWTTPEEVWAGVRETGNDLAAPARALMPALENVFAALERDPRARAVALSGSGATVFALTKDKSDAEALAANVASLHSGWCVRACVLDGAAAGR